MTPDTARTAVTAHLAALAVELPGISLRLDDAGGWWVDLPHPTRAGSTEYDAVALGRSLAGAAACWEAVVAGIRRKYHNGSVRTVAPNRATAAVTPTGNDNRADNHVVGGNDAAANQKERHPMTTKQTKKATRGTAKVGTPSTPAAGVRVNGTKVAKAAAPKTVNLKDALKAAVAVMVKHNVPTEQPAAPVAPVAAPKASKAAKAVSAPAVPGDKPACPKCGRVPSNPAFGSRVCLSASACAKRAAAAAGTVAPAKATKAAKGKGKAAPVAASVGA